MQRLGPEGDVYHGGTFAGHPLSMAAGITTLRELSVHPPYDQLETLSRRLVDGLVQEAQRTHLPIQINWLGSMFTVFFSQGPVRNFTQAKASRREQFAQWAQALQRRGILVAPSPFEALFVSTAHTALHIDRFLEASHEAFASIRAGVL